MTNSSEKIIPKPIPMPGVDYVEPIKLRSEIIAESWEKKYDEYIAKHITFIISDRDRWWLEKVVPKPTPKGPVGIDADRMESYDTHDIDIYCEGFDSCLAAIQSNYARLRGENEKL